MATPTFVGFDDDIEICLKKYGLATRNERSDQHICVYKIGESSYEYGFLHESEVHDLLHLKSWLQKDRRDEFLNFCGQKLEAFDTLPFMHKTFSLIQFFGHEDIMGKVIQPLTLKEAIATLD